MTALFQDPHHLPRDKKILVPFSWTICPSCERSGHWQGIHEELPSFHRIHPCGLCVQGALCRVVGHCSVLPASVIVLLFLGRRARILCERRRKLCCHQWHAANMLFPRPAVNGKKIICPVKNNSSNTQALCRTALPTTILVTQAVTRRQGSAKTFHGRLCHI